MGFFTRNKKNEDDIKCIATARALLERCLDVEESSKLSHDLRLTKEEFSEFHVQKRFLAIKTVVYTAVISMEIQKRNKFVEIFIKEKEERENIKQAPKGVQKMLIAMNEASDGAYHSCFEKVTKYVQQNECEPVEILRDGFSQVFCAFLEKEKSEIYLNIGRNVFDKHHHFAMTFLEKI